MSKAFVKVHIKRNCINCDFTAQCHNYTTKVLVFPLKLMKLKVRTWHPTELSPLLELISFGLP